MDVLKPGWKLWPRAEEKPEGEHGGRGRKSGNEFTHGNWDTAHRGVGQGGCTQSQHR